MKKSQYLYKIKNSYEEEEISFYEYKTLKDEYENSNAKQKQKLDNLDKLDYDDVKGEIKSYEKSSYLEKIEEDYADESISFMEYKTLKDEYFNLSSEKKKKLDNKHKGRISDSTLYYIMIGLAILNSISGGPPILYILFMFLPYFIKKLL